MRDAGRMDQYLIDGFRRRVAAGEALAADESQRLIDALDDARRAATTPTEFLVRVARNVDDLNGWTADHPLLRLSISATSPADALVLAGVELGRTLDEPATDDRRLGDDVGRGGR